MGQEQGWSEFLFLSIGALLAWIVWTVISLASGYGCSAEIRRTWEESSRIVAAGLARPVDTEERKRSLRKRLVPDICSPERFEESFEQERRERGK